MDKLETGNVVEDSLVEGRLAVANTEQAQTKLTIDELSAQIKRMTDYVQQHSQSNTAAVHNTLKATMRYRDSLAASLIAKSNV
ncbi:hypothetical protein [Moritella sp. Urea-trap-13]|uniref:hypothetical protein n=1 Tax=Moritella sp. Urea-trap-13 TaxID=2058327 RepID=UPI000C328D04|nr:hypothetical protein [Moritella sp. Urea-trap-13]PKH08237.1 hypothetical protein CXF93_04125 [Moritella sp. Urea-trap-13]